MRTCSILILLFVGCDASDASDTPGERHGHDGLLGAAWTGEVFREGDVTIDLGMAFTLSAVTVSNDCHAGERALRAEVTVPVAYRYSVTALDAGAAGSIACGITLAAGRYDFEILGGGVRVQAGELVFDLARNGTTDGLFGTWSTATDDGSLSWTIAANAVRLTRHCPAVSSEPVVLTVPAETRGFVAFLEGETETEVDGDFECSVTAQARVAGYSLDGDTLTITEGDDEVELRR